MHSCGRKSQKALGDKANLYYEVTTDRTVYNRNIKIHSFYEVMASHPPHEDSLPEQVQVAANRTLDHLHNSDNLTALEKRINTELVCFHMLDLYVLPVFLNTGNVEASNLILGYLVELKETASEAELYLQARSLQAISQGGYYYPELQEYLETAIQEEINEQSHEDEDLKKAEAIIRHLQEEGVH